MSAVRTIAELEISRHRKWSPVKNPTVFLGIWLILIAAGVTFGYLTSSIVAVIQAASYLSIYGSFGLALGVVLPILSQERMWFLGYPHARRSLLFGKWVAACTIVCRGMALSWGACVVSTSVLIATSRGRFELTGTEAGQGVWWILISLCYAFVVTVFAAFSPMFQTGWWRLCWFFSWLLISTWQIPLWLVTNPNHVFVTGAVILYCAVVIAVGLLLTLLLYRYAPAVLSKVARHTGANREYGRPDNGRPQAKGARMLRRDRVSKANVTMFWALVWLEYSRYRLLGRDVSRIAQTVAGLVLLAVAVGSAVAFRLSGDLIHSVAFFFDIVTLVGLIGCFVQMMKGMNDGFNKWFVTFPIQRTKAITARGLAWYLAFSLCMLELLGAFAIGAIFMQLVHPVGAPVWNQGLQVLWRGALLSLVFLLVMYAILAAAPALMAKPVYSILLTVLVYVGGIQLWNFGCLKVLFHYGPGYWVALLVVILAGTPSAMFSIRYAALHMDRLARGNSRTKTSWGQTWGSSWR
ncbi:hypothetical protein [Alicyclobacillus dauci]|uniref:ABC transporter permease n=1 Tax=Alicyclobacillus dauci TaxID=1475485 RepID=A0ABY6Z6D3_9BACL|nr:hypothetical protein [Alicyclobacillus dauci]WAH38449.1 hypothetical protein NZD86_08205 [Alicyclobacillus dauci]